MEISDFKVAPDSQLSLDQYKTHSKKKVPNNLKRQAEANREAIAEFQNKLYAENRQALLIIFQGMDGSGKDSTIKHIMAGVNPQGVLVHSFKHPTAIELSHDYLWRHMLTLPEQGQIVIFNRSHYENVLISRVHPDLVLAERIPGVEKVEDIDGKFWDQRYRQIRRFEKTISENGTQVLKFFLHLSKDEQKKRFLERIEKKDKHWKFSAGDIVERGLWDEYQEAYEKALAATSTKRNPWYIVPADDKWFAHQLISQIIIEKLAHMDIQFPVPDAEQEQHLEEAKAMLLKEK